MKILLLLIFLVSCTSSLKTDDNSIGHRPDLDFKYSVLQMSTDDTSTIIRVVYPHFAKPQFKVTDTKNREIAITKVKTFTRKHSQFVVSHLVIKNLKVSEKYALEIIGEHKYWDQDKRYFETLSLESKKTKVLVASCMTTTYNEIGNIIWPQAFAHKPDIVFLIGDNLYADVHAGIYFGNIIDTPPAHLWDKHVEHAMTMKLSRMKNLVPTMTTWDDHDYGVNDGDRSYKYKTKSKVIYQTFFPVEENKIVKKGVGVSNQLVLRGNRFFFMDARSFRASKKEKDGQHLGLKQKKQLYVDLKNSSELNWLIKGDQFYGGYHKYESYEGVHGTEFKKFTAKLKEINKKYVFLAGDRHLIEVMRIKDFNTYEYTVSGIHTKMYPGSLKHSPNKIRVDGFDGLPNYAIIDIDLSQGNKIQFKGYTTDKLLIDRRDSI